MATMGTFQELFEHNAPAVRKEFKVEPAFLVVLNEESTTALNEFETVDLKKQVQVLGSDCDTTVMWETTSDSPQLMQCPLRSLC